MFDVRNFEVERNTYCVNMGTLNKVNITVACNDDEVKKLHDVVLNGFHSSRYRHNNADVNYISAVKQILISDKCTIVFWLDGTKTIVRCAAGSQFNVYHAFTAALAKKIYGSNSKL